jgi:PP-loop superfamily ATP-utilizing enzyme
MEEISKKLQMIGFSSVIIDPDGYKTGKLNQLRILE